MLSLQTPSALTKETSSLNRKYISMAQILATVVLSFIIAPAAMSEGIYKWVDDNGKIHSIGFDSSDLDMLRSENNEINTDDSARLTHKEK